VYVGDIRLGDTFDIKFCTVATTGAPTTLAGSPVVSAYPGNSTTQLTAGITLTVDFDAVTGLHNVRVVATSGNGYATATNYALVITTGTVGGTSVVGYVVASFSIEARSALMPTTAARTLDVTATGAGGVDWANVEAPTTAVGLTGTTIATSQVVASVSGAVGSVTGAVGSVTGAVGSVAAGGITAASIATGAVDADAIAADAVTEIQSGLATAAALDIVDNFLDTEVAAILAAVDTEVAAIITLLGTPAGVSLAADIAAIEAQTDDIGAAGAGLTALATQASVNTIDDFLDTEIAAIVTAVVTDIPALIAALNNLSAAAVNAEMVDALNVDTYAQPGQGTPAATTTIRLMLAYLYKAYRNRHTQTASEYDLYNDDAVTVDQKAAVSDDATTFDRGEVATGP